MPTLPQPLAFRLEYTIPHGCNNIMHIVDPTVHAPWISRIAAHNTRGTLYALNAATAHDLTIDIQAALQWLYDQGGLYRALRPHLLRWTRAHRAGGNITGPALYKTAHLLRVCALIDGIQRRTR